MEPTIHTITLDLQRPCKFGALTVKKGDTHRLLQLRLLSGGKSYAISPDCYGVFTAQKPDGTVIYNPCVREGNTLLYQLTPQTTSAVGTLECEIKLYGPEDALLTTASFTLTVEDTVYAEGEDAITSAGEATALTQLITQARDTIEQMEKVLENEPNHAIIDDTKVGTDAWSARNIVDKLCPSFTETGAVVACEPVEGYPLEVTAQEDATITRCGKNLFCFSASASGDTAYGGLTSKYEKGDSAIVLNGTATAEHAKAIARGLLLKAGTYTISVNGLNTVGSSHDRLVLSYTNDAGTSVDVNKIMQNAPKTFTLDHDTTVLINAVIAKDSAYNNKTISVQIEKGTVATEYAPYKGESFASGDTVYAIKGINTLWADAGEISVTGKADPVAIIEKLTNAVIASGGNI